jgi:hypothetical protein
MVFEQEAATKILEGRPLDRAFASPGLCPWKNGKAQIDGGGLVEYTDSLIVVAEPPSFAMASVASGKGIHDVAEDLVP